MQNYIPSIIEAFGTIIAAVLASGIIRNMFKNHVIPLLQVYSGNENSARKKIRKAKKNIYIVVSVGNHLLEACNKEIRSKLRKGVKLKFLIQDERMVHEQKKYIKGDEGLSAVSSKEKRDKVLKSLEVLKNKFPKLIEVREFHSMLTASYIGIDIDDDDSEQRLSHSLIQIMIYQYGVESAKTPITWATREDHSEIFKSTEQSILHMWDMSDELLEAVIKVESF